MTGKELDKSKPRYSRISDILDLIVLMQSKALGVTLADIQDRFGISRRTAERLRDAITNILHKLMKSKLWEKKSIGVLPIAI